MNLVDYGFNPEDNLRQLGSEGQNTTRSTPARVVAVYRERFELVCEYGPIFGRLKAGTYFSGAMVEFPTTGDFVLISYNPRGESQILQTLPRKSFFSRRDPDKGRGEQAISANFDYVFIMQSLNQDFNPKRLERYVTLAWQSGAQPVLVLTKADLVDDYSKQIDLAAEVACGVDIHAVSTHNGSGLETLRTYLQPKKTIVLLGSSGVGKSSLVNALAGEIIMAVNDIRDDDGKGRHTTTHRQLVMLQSGAMIIDTPGMRELGMWDVTTGLSESFADVERFFAECKFSDCRHQTEPGCAILAALKNGELPRERWDSYLNLKREAKYTDDKDAYMRYKEQFFKNVNKLNRQRKKN